MHGPEPVERRRQHPAMPPLPVATCAARPRPPLQRVEGAAARVRLG